MVENSIEQIFEMACKYPSDQQAEFLETACGNDATLKSQVIELLKADQSSSSLLDDGKLLCNLNPFRPPQIGELFGHYKLLQRIGDGGMGLVFLAQQQQPVKRQVAIKVIPNSHICSDEVLHRFSAERQVLAMFDHPNVTKVYDGGITEEGLPYFVMEHVHGQPITEFCNHQRLGIDQRLKIYIDVCRAFEHAHQRGVIHRDIKPSNVLVSLQDGKPVPKVIDFGIAKALGEVTFGTNRVVTQYGAFMGTPQYMSPEQARMDNTPVDIRTDVYSLGVLLYELLTGSPPITKHEMDEIGLLETLERVRDGEVLPPSQQLDATPQQLHPKLPEHLSQKKLTRVLRGDLDWITLAALAKNPAQRYDSVKSLREDIQNYLVGNPVTVAAPSTLYKTLKFVARNKIPCASLAVVITVMVSATIFSLLQAKKSKWARIRSESLALQLKLESRKLAAALENAKSGETLKQSLLRRKKYEATLAKTFNRFINFELSQAVEQANLNSDTAESGFLFNLAGWLPGVYSPVGTNSPAGQGCFPEPVAVDEQNSAFLLEDVPLFVPGPYPFEPGDPNWMSPTYLGPLSMIGIETLHYGTSDGRKMFPLVNHSVSLMSYPQGDDSFKKMQIESAIQFMTILLSEQLKEFEPNDITIAESKLLLAQLFLADNSFDQAESLLSTLNYRVDNRDTDKQYRFLIQLLLLECEQQQHGRVARSEVNAIASKLETLELDPIIQNILQARILNGFTTSK